MILRIEPLQVANGKYQLHDYDEINSTFDWKKTEQSFSWCNTGQVNMAYEAVDRHAESELKDKVALYFENGVRKESYTFQDVKEWTNRAANVFQQAGLEKGDRLFVFMPRSPELYFSIIGAIEKGDYRWTSF